MIYYVTLNVETRGSLVEAIPRSMRHIMGIVDKSNLNFTKIKKRTLVGWLTQKQFDKLVHDCFLKSRQGKNSIMDRRWCVKFVRRLESTTVTYNAFVEAFPQKFKRSGKPHKQPTIMEYKTGSQRQRVNKAILKKYA